MRSPLQSRAILERVDLIAGEIGRLRRRVEPGDSLAHLCNRLAGHVATLDTMLRPTAAELAARAVPRDDVAVMEAIAAVDARARELDRLLGEVKR